MGEVKKSVTYKLTISSHVVSSSQALSPWYVEASTQGFEAAMGGCSSVDCIVGSSIGSCVGGLSPNVGDFEGDSLGDGVDCGMGLEVASS